VDVIVLNGASSAGKTSLARALQDLLLPHIWLTFGVDSLINAMPPKLDGSPEGLLIAPGGAVTVGRLYRAMEDAWRLGVAAMARTGVRLVLDEVMFGGGEDQQLWAEALTGLQVLWVGVHCDPAVADQRELARGDRVVGLSARQAPLVHRGFRYDVEVDTTHPSAEACAGAIVEHITGD
jgi:chloramphenicol 3-O phosphotransferase